MSFRKVKDHSEFVRDNRSNAIINTSADVYVAAMLRKHRAKEKAKELTALRNEVKELKALINARLKDK